MDVAGLEVCVGGKLFGGRSCELLGFFDPRLFAKPPLSDTPRRVERILNTPLDHNRPCAEVQALIHTHSTPSAKQGSTSLPPPLATGLLMLSINQLRSYGLTYLPPRSQLQHGFLEDVDDLEDAGARLTREDRLRIVQRMWRSWGGVLGWGGDVLGQ